MNVINFNTHVCLCVSDVCLLNDRIQSKVLFGTNYSWSLCCLCCPWKFQVCSINIWYLWWKKREEEEINWIVIVLILREIFLCSIEVMSRPMGKFMPIKRWKERKKNSFHLHDCRNKSENVFFFLQETIWLRIRQVATHVGDSIVADLIFPGFHWNDRMKKEHPKGLKEITIFRYFRPFIDFSLFSICSLLRWVEWE